MHEPAGKRIVSRAPINMRCSTGASASANDFGNSISMSDLKLA
jgi:hypothetical protein